MADHDSGYHVTPGREAFALPGRRREVRSIEQIAIRFPSFAKAQYRWRFADGTRSAWRAAPTRDLLKAPPDARCIEWREYIEARPPRRRRPAKPRFDRPTPCAPRLKVVR